MCSIMQRLYNYIKAENQNHKKVVLLCFQIRYFEETDFLRKHFFLIQAYNQMVSLQALIFTESILQKNLQQTWS